MSELFTQKRVSIALGILLCLTFLGPATGTATFFYRDFGVMGYPTAAYHREMFWRGEFPLWNPFSNCGVPFLAQWGTMTLYPFSLIYLVLPFPWSLNFFCLLHLWWGAVGIFVLAERWTKSKPAAAVASVLFLFNGITLSSLSWPNYTVAFAWTPWIILFACHRRNVMLSAATGAMQMLAGVPELSILTWLLVGAFWLLDYKNLGAIAARGLFIVTLVAAFTAIQLLPFFELLSLSHRQLGLAGTKWALPSTALPNFALPMLHAFSTPQGTWFQHNQHFLSSTYLGLTAVLLAVLGFNTDRRSRLLAVASVLSILLAVGVLGFWQKLPLLGLARYPVKFALLLAFTVPLLAAFGIRQLEIRKISLQNFAMAASFLLALAIGFTYWTWKNPFQYDFWPATWENSRLRFAAFLAALALIVAWLKTTRPLALAALLVLLAIDGRFHLKNQNPITEFVTLRRAQETRKLPTLGEGRVFITPEAEKALLISQIKNLDTDFIGKQMAAWSHLNLVELAPKVNGSATLQIKEQKQIQDWLYTGTNSNLEAWLDFLGITHVTAPDKVVEWTTRGKTPPPARVMKWQSQKGRTFEQVTTAGYDPRIGAFATNHQSDASGRVETIFIKPGHIEIKAFSDETARMLVLPYTWHPAWTAELLSTGNTLPVFKANHAFQAVPIGAGENHVRLYYHDRRFLLGAAVSILALISSFVLVGARTKREP